MPRRLSQAALAALVACVALAAGAAAAQAPPSAALSSKARPGASR